MIHLHVHSEYSLLDGVPKPAHIAAYAARQGFPAVALTDHGVMYGAIEFAEACKEQGVKAIIGVEAYLCRRGQGIEQRDYRFDQSPYHLLLLAANQEGYRNLLRLTSIANTKGFHYHPRIDHQLLLRHAEGLICTSGCMKSEIASLFIQGREEEARAALLWYREIFGDRFWAELQGHDLEPLKKYNRWLVATARELGIPLIATNDAHYLAPEDRSLYETVRQLRFVQEGGTDNNESHQPRVELDLCSADALIEKLTRQGVGHAIASEAVANTLMLGERSFEPFTYRDKYHLPAISSPHPKHTPSSFFSSMAKLGFERRYGIPANENGAWEHDTADEQMLHLCIVPLAASHPGQTMPPPIVSRVGAAALRERLQMEIETIQKMNFVDYMLIVWDIVRYAKSAGIWWNVRGSAAGSLVVYSLGLTRVEPVGAELYFERFLNPERVTMPDIDIDFPEDRRGKMIDYTIQRYGAEQVAAIITYNTMGAKMAIRETGRILNADKNLVEKIVSLIPNRLGITLQEAIDEAQSLKRLIEQDAKAREIIDLAKRLEGRVRHVGTHAAGIVVADRPLYEYVPLHRIVGTPSSDKIDVMTQYEMTHLETIGLLKMDYLGLTLLTMMQEACALIEKRHGMKFDLDSIPYDDPVIYRALGEGDVVGIFQVEGSGMRRMLMSMKPKRFEHVVAGIALFRPGPMQYIDQYISRMHGREPVSYRHAHLAPILEETYGIIVYQEQIMRIARDFAGYSMGEADTIRKAVGKKLKEQLEKHQQKFITGAEKKGYAREIATAIWDDILYFARYGFNKSHAASFAMLTCQSMYLKQRYPLEFYVALINAEAGDEKKMALILSDCALHGVKVLPPHIEKSDMKACIEQTDDGEAIRLGLSNVKFVGQSAEAIIQERNRRPFESVHDLIHRNIKNKRALQVLADIGALDSLPGGPWTGNQIAEMMEQKHKGDQLSLFEMLSSPHTTTGAENPVLGKDPLPKQRALAQVEYIGFPMNLLHYPALEMLENLRIKRQIKSNSQTVTDKNFSGRARVLLHIVDIKPSSHPQMVFIEGMDRYGKARFSLFLNTRGVNPDRLYPGVAVDVLLETRFSPDRTQQYLTCQEILGYISPGTLTQRKNTPGTYHNYQIQS